MFGNVSPFLQWHLLSLLFYVIKTEPGVPIWQPITCFLLMIMVKLFTNRWSQSCNNNGISQLRIAAQLYVPGETGYFTLGWHIIDRELENRCCHAVKSTLGLILMHNRNIILGWIQKTYVFQRDTVHSIDSTAATTLICCWDVAVGNGNNVQHFMGKAQEIMNLNISHNDKDLRWTFPHLSVPHLQFYWFSCSLKKAR